MKVILVVGPSGAGKDTLLRAAREHFAAVPSLGFARRYITRPPGVDEDNYYVDEVGFSLLENAAFFCFKLARPSKLLRSATPRNSSILWQRIGDRFHFQVLHCRL
jgi:ribose 1,5-bisphosphokinase PhnN